MGKYHSELLMLLNLAFLMKCKYISVETVFLNKLYIKFAFYFYDVETKVWLVQIEDDFGNI